MSHTPPNETPSNADEQTRQMEPRRSVTEPVIHSVDRVLHPELQTPIVTTCAGLSRLRPATP
ncbi:MAG: hypothetical protein QF561_05610 [Phycisphaerales bacterium]|nr:hypothetical protein [Phycisphaerales bacterium]